MKKVVIIILIILISSLFYSCKSKKTTTEIYKTDTIYKSEIIKITPARLNSLLIESVCDSLGKLKPFNYTFGTGNDKVSLKTINNTISLEVNYDSIKQSAINEYKSKTDINKKEIIKPYIPKWVWYSIILNVLFILWTFRKPLLSRFL